MNSRHWRRLVPVLLVLAAWYGLTHFRPARAARPFGAFRLEALNVGGPGWRARRILGDGSILGLRMGDLTSIAFHRGSNQPPRTFP